MSDVVKLTFKELEIIAQQNDQKEEEENQKRLKEEAKKKRDEERKKKRPTVGIYRPPSLLRHKQEKESAGSVQADSGDTNKNTTVGTSSSVGSSGCDAGGNSGLAGSKSSAVIDLQISEEDWDKEISGSSGLSSKDTSSGLSSKENSSGLSSKENSVEKELQAVNTSLQGVKISPAAHERTSQSSHKNDSRRRSKRPEIQRYVPKGRMLEQQHGSGVDDGDSSVGMGSSHSPSPARSPPLVTHTSPSPRKIDLKNMQVTVANDTPTSADTRKHQEPKDTSDSKTKSMDFTVQPRNTSLNQGYARGRGRRSSPALKSVGRNNAQSPNTAHQDAKTPDKGVGSLEMSPSVEVKPAGDSEQKEYLVPSRPNTIGQEAVRMDVAPVGSDKSPQPIESESDSPSSAILNRFSKSPPNKNKSRSVDKLNKTADFEEEDFYPDPQNLKTLVFERSRSSDQLNLSGRSSTKPPVPRSASGGMKSQGKRSPYTRKRADSFSSDVSTGTGSDWSTEDLDWEGDGPVDSLLDWTAEVDREFSMQVHDQRQKMAAWFEKQEGLSQPKGPQNSVSPFRDDVMTSSNPDCGALFGAKSDFPAEKSNTLPFAHKRKQDEKLRGRRTDRRGSLGFRSRDSSVSSVQSSQSVHSVQSAYSGDGRRRRRRRRKSSSSSQKGRSGSLEGRNLSIQVTCGKQSQRQVTMDAGGGGGSADGSGRQFSRQNSREKFEQKRDRTGWGRPGHEDRNLRDETAKNKQFRQGRDLVYNRNEPRDSNKWQKEERFADRDRHDNRYGKDIQGSRSDRRNEDERRGPHSSQGQRDKRSSNRSNRSGGNIGHENDEKASNARNTESEINPADRDNRNNSSSRNMHPDERQWGQRSDFESGRRDERGWQGHQRHSDSRDSRDTRYHRNENKEKLGHTEDVHRQGGGIIHLPSQQPPTDQHQHRQQYQHDAHKSRGSGAMGRGMGRGRDRQNSGGGRQKSLFDPDNPSKPIIIEEAKPKLDFKETDSYPGSPQSPHLMDAPPMEAYKAGFRPYPHPGYGYGYPMAPPHPGMVPPPPRMVPPPGQEGMYYGYPGAYPEAGGYKDDWYGREPYFYSESEPSQPGLGGHSRSQCRMMAEQLLREALPMDKQLNNLIARRIAGEENMNMINQLRRELLMRFEQLILLDPELANRQNVEQLLWKSIFYHMVEMIRKQHDAGDAQAHGKLVEILDEGTTFYESLLRKLQSTFNFSLEAFLDASQLPPDNVSRTSKLALLSAQRTLICLGDIARYREQNNEGTKVNYAKARSWYTKAQQLAPKNGRPYNQLAILALYTKRKLDAVYYYMRSLAASNPFLTARESLMALFEDVRKKAEATELKRMEEIKRMQAIRKNSIVHKHRVEIWMKNDGTREESNVDDNYWEDLTKLDPVQLNKRFVLSFLNVHGKLFTKTGMEMFVDSCGQMLREFKVLLKDNGMGTSRLLQLMAINMFAIENTALKEETPEAACRSLLQEHSVQLGLDMFGILVEQCTTELREHVNSADFPTNTFSNDLQELIPSIKVWTDWMICHADLWNPPPSCRDPNMGPEIDVWNDTATLCNILKDMDTSEVKLCAERRNGLDPVILSEDTMMAGFVPLLSTPLNNTFVDSSVDKDVAKDSLRVEKLRVFGEYLCGIEPPMLAYSVETRQYYSVAPSQGYEDADTANQEQEHDQSEDDDVVIESEEEITHDLNDEHVQELRARKQELQKKMEEKKKQQENRKKLLETNRHRSIEIEIRPIFLIPDTNCFIDHLPSLKRLINERQYNIIVPLVVINELDGLSQGSKAAQYDNIDRAERVHLHAKTAISYLEEEFEQKNSHLKALTSKGSVMETISYRSEETDNSGNNDDLILSCCTYYCKDKARDYMPKDKDTPVHLYREVVLLTDDRNLRLKAHTHNVPVKEVPAFMKWSHGT